METGREQNNTDARHIDASFTPQPSKEENTDRCILHVPAGYQNFAIHSILSLYPTIKNKQLTQ